MWTLRTIAERGQEIRVWCFRCARGTTIDAGIWERFQERGWTLELPAAGRHFKCRTCRRSDEVLVLPTGAPDLRVRTGKDVVEMFFHGMRAMRKRRRPR